MGTAISARIRIFSTDIAPDVSSCRARSPLLILFNVVVMPVPFDTNISPNDYYAPIGCLFHPGAIDCILHGNGKPISAVILEPYVFTIDIIDGNNKAIGRTTRARMRMYSVAIAP